MTPGTPDLETAASRLWHALAELVVTVFEDHPADVDLVLVDDLMERVSELQAAGAELRSGASRPTREALAEVDDAADRAVLLYWRDLRGFRTTYELRRAARHRTPEWRSWVDGVEQALDRCAEPLEALRAAVRASWRHPDAPLISALPRSTGSGGHHE